MTGTEDLTVTVAVFRSQASAEMARQALEAAGIPARTEADRVGARVGLQVSASDAEEAREILAAGSGPPLGEAPTGPRPTP